MVKFDPTKPVQTKDGRKATIVDQDYNGRLLTVVTSECGGKGWRNHDPQTGLCLYVYGDRCDLVNIPEKHVKWLNFYENGWGEIFDSREMADDRARVRGAFSFEEGRRVACIRLEFEEGEGLD